MIRLTSKLVSSEFKPKYETQSRFRGECDSMGLQNALKIHNNFEYFV